MPSNRNSERGHVPYAGFKTEKQSCTDVVVVVAEDFEEKLNRRGSSAASGSPGVRRSIRAVAAHRIEAVRRSNPHETDGFDRRCNGDRCRRDGGRQRRWDSGGVELGSSVVLVD